MRHVRRSHLLTTLGGALFVVAALTGLMFYAGIWRTGSGYEVSAFVANARGIAKDSTVTIAGLKAGRVTRIRRNGTDAILTMRIDRGPTPLPVDSKVQLRLRSLAGEAYVQVFPGHSPQRVRAGGSLGLAQSEEYTEVDQILSRLAGPGERRTRDALQGAGGSLDGQGRRLNRTLGGAAALVTDSPPLTSTMAVHRRQLADIVQNLGVVMRAVGDRTAAVAGFARGARTTFRAVGARDVALGRTLRQLPGLVRSVRATSRTIDATAPRISPAVDHLAGAMRRITPAVRRLGTASRSGLRMVDALGDASPALRTTLRHVETLRGPAVAALPQLHALTCQVNPMLRYIEPYAKDLGAFFEDFGAAVNWYDTAGHQLMVSLEAPPNGLLRGVANQPASDAVQTLLNFGVLNRTGTENGYDARPLPGQMGDTVRGRGLTGPAQFGARFTYPRVTADCAR